MSASTDQTFTGGTGPPRLVGLVGAIEGRRVPIDRPSMTLGREADCEIELDHAFLSRRHAAFDTDGAGRVVVRDLGSTQGTYVNGSRIDASPLAHGDVLGFGPGGLVTFRFEAAGVRESSAQSAEPSSVDALRTRLRNAGSAPVRTRPMPEVAAGPPPRVDPAAGPVVLRIGRAPDNDVVLDAPGVSRRHARIDYSAGEPRLSDDGSLNGTFVNGEPVRGARPLAPTDLVFLGGFLLRVNGREITSHDLGASRLDRFRNHEELRREDRAPRPCRSLFSPGVRRPHGAFRLRQVDADGRPQRAAPRDPRRRPRQRARPLPELRRGAALHRLRASAGHPPRRADGRPHAPLRGPAPPARGHASRDARQVIDGVVRDVGLAEHRETSFKQLSGGSASG